jgi:ketosteroid isomerase-like protein
MSVEANKEIVRQFYAAIQREDYESVARMCHKDFKFYLQVDTRRLQELSATRSLN